ncbi:MAG TPA: tripartite tricarboxylate transporter substrate binding protein [Burkholderiales bacterium]|nr:tripartite tricarboxylate transporter substrate binding protein [Burkholderiales bacterium]
MGKGKRRWPAAALAVLLLAAASAAAAQAYPNRAVRLVISFPPGGALDVVGRPVAQKLAEAFKQPVVVENRGGAGGTIGSEYVARQPADGHTLLLTAGTSHGTGSSFYPGLPYDPVKDFVPIAAAVEVVVTLAAHPGFAPASVRELIDYARAHPGKLSYGSSGIGSPMHLAGELLRETAGIDIVHVPYKGAGPAITDLLGGQIPLAFVSLASVMGHVKSGKLRAMAVVEAQRYKGMPEIPTIKETLPQYDMFTSWLGFFAPAGTPRDIVARINAEINRALADPELAAKLESAALVRLNTTPEQFAAMVHKELEIGARFARRLGVK